MTRTNRPGPRGTSCLTCKRRHKKCDQRLPVCERCETGGFDCLGYEHNLDTRFRGYRRKQPPPILPGPPGPEGSACLELESPGVSASSSSMGRSPEDATRTLTLNCSNPVHMNLYNGGTPDLSISGLYVQLPYYSFDPLKTFLTSPSFDDYLLAQHGKLMDQWYFKPANIQKEAFQEGIVTHLQSSLEGFSRWIALIGMGICEAFMTGDTSQDQLHGLWTAHIENFLKRELLYGTNSRESHSQRRDWVHVSLLRTLVTHNSNLYQVLRSLTPAFLQLVFSDPTLWPSESGFNYVPLLNVLAFGSHELAYFALIDCTCAMAFGVPQQVEYDTVMYALPGSSPLHQWAHGSPIEFQVVLADINACRDKSPVARNWRDIEKFLEAWQPRPGELTFTESWMTVAWYAVQESWRLALLSYLYLAVCNASSNDPRIQSCVRQLLQVVGTVKKHKASSVEVSFLVQYLIAGICARSETHRKIVRERLEKPKDPKLWVIRGSDFVPVLDHLWHGAAVDGRPVKWSDYVSSREAVLPIVL
ncbi:hypothetical protein OPQ81_000343 [Rhizoctonia solani]|nr:hypothetical protein OPQ81_000343 [Rhizoctonia solani]